MAKTFNDSTELALAESRAAPSTLLVKSGAWPPSRIPPTVPGGLTPAPTTRALLSALRRRWHVAIGLGAILALLSAGAAWYLIPARYTASTELRISSVPERVVFTTVEERATFTTYKQSQMRMMKTPLVLGAALRDPEVANLSIVRAKEDPVPWLQESLVITTPAMEFLQIALAGENPQELALLVNAIAAAYLEEVVNDEQNKRRERQKTLEKIHRDLDEKIRSREQRLKKLAESLSTGDTKTLSMKEQFAVEYHARLRNELAQITFDLTRARIALAGKKAGIESIDERPIPDAVIDNHLGQDGEIRRLGMRIEQTRELMTKYEGIAPNHPNVAAHQKELERLEKQIEDARQTQRPAAAQRVRGEIAERLGTSEAELEEKVGLLTATADELQKQLDSQQNEQKRTGSMAFELASHNKEITQLESIAKTVADELKRIEIELTAPPRISVLQPAQVPRLRDLRPKTAGTAISGLGIFGLVLFGVVWKDFKAHRVSSLDEVTENLGMRLVGSIPLVPRLTANHTGRRLGKQREYWHNALSESIDAVRTILLRDTSLESINMVMVSSAMPGEGKTTLSCHLGHSLARSGRKTLLVDTDMRRPSVHTVLGQPLAPGFCELLRGEATLDEVIRPTQTPGLSMLPAGRIDETALRELAQDGANIFIELRKRYQFVVVDSSPVLPVADALLVAQHVDAVVFSVRRDVSRCAKVATACQRLEMLGVPFLGIVAIGLDDGAFRYPTRAVYGAPLNTANSTASSA